MSYYVFHTACKLFVKGVSGNAGFKGVATPADAKPFKTEAAARAWLEKHINCGYGLTRNNTTVVSA